MGDLSSDRRIEDVRSAVEAALGYRVDLVRPLGAGADHRSYLVGEDLVARISRMPSLDRSDLEREAQLLDLVAESVRVTVPRVVAADEPSGVVVMTRVPGVSMFDTGLPGDALADGLADLMGSLAHATDRAVSRMVVEPDPYPLHQYWEDATVALAEVSEVLSVRQRTLVTNFVSSPPPPEPTLAVLCHNDLGAEHLMVDPVQLRLLGVIDWSDAAVTDPARDLGRLYRDLGPAVSRRVVAQLWFRDEPALWGRTAFHARCSLLEDLRFGLEHDERYARAALRNLSRTFSTA